DFAVAVGRNDADLGDLGRAGHVLRTAVQVLDDLGHGEIDAALEVHRVDAGGDRGHAFAHDGLGQHGGGGGAVTGEVVGLRGHFAQHLRAHVLELVLELDLLGDGDAVLGDARRAEALVEHDVAALRAERDLDGVGERVDALEDAFARVAREFHVLGSHVEIPFFGSRKVREKSVQGYRQPTMPMMSLSFMISRSSPSSLTSVPDHLPNSTRSPALTSSGVTLPSSPRVPEPTATISPSLGFSLALSGMMMPPAVFSSASMRRTRTRSCSGRNAMCMTSSI